MVDFGKVGVAIIEHYTGLVVGDAAIGEIKKPYIRAELINEVVKAAERSEIGWVANYADRELAAAVAQLPLHDLPSVRSAIQKMVDNPTDPVTAKVLQGRLNAILPSNFDQEQVERAVASYLDALRIELLGITEFREKIQTLAAISTARSTSHVAEGIDILASEFQQLNTHLSNNSPYAGT